MRTPKDVFNSVIKSFLKEIPDSLGSKIIRKVEQEYSSYRSYYEMFDSFSDKIGITYIAEPIFDKEKEDYIRFMPYINYYPWNILGKEPENIPLISFNNGPMKLDKCYELLTKEYIYELTRIPNILEIIEKK